MSGCVSVSAPKEVHVGSSSRPEKVNSGRVPKCDSLAEAEYELEKAYANIRYLEDELAGCEDKAKKYKRERDKCEDRLERYEDD